MRVILFALTLVAIARACVREGPKDDKDMEKEHKKQEKKEMHRVLFALLDGLPGFSYMDEKSGMPMGMAKEVIERACGACSENLRCDTVYIGNNLGRCFDPEAMTGEGLMDYHYHACVGFVPTIMRSNVFNFSSSMIHAPMGAVYARPDIDLTDTAAMLTQSLGVRQYWYLDQRCVRKHLSLRIDGGEGDSLPDSNVKVMSVQSWAELREKLDNDEVQYIMMPSGDPASEGLVMVGEPMTCSKDGGGHSLMHRKDMDFEWFEMCSWMGMRTEESDPMGKHGEYRRMCQKWGLEELCYTDDELDMWDAKMMKKMMEKEKEMGHE